MKKFIKFALTFAMAVVCVFAVGCGGETSSFVNGKVWNVTSPDGEINVELVLDDYGTMFYSVTDGDTTVLEKSRLGWTLADDNLSAFLTYVSDDSNIIMGSYENKTGRHREVEYECAETTVTVRSVGGMYLDVIMRAYNDGYAFRYKIYGEDGETGTIDVVEENSEFALPAESDTLMQAYTPSSLNCFSYEEDYIQRASNRLDGKYVSMPMSYRAGKSETYLLITESGLVGSGFYGSFLKESEENFQTGILQTVIGPAGIQKDNNIIEYPFTSPWRVGAVGTLKEVVETEMVEKVYDDAEYWKPDNYDSLSDAEKSVYNYEWVDPGLSAWSWLQESSLQISGKRIEQNNLTETGAHYRYIDLAAEMGWKYYLLDGGWHSGNSDATIMKLSNYAKAKGVKLVAWAHAFNLFGNGSPVILDNILSKWASYGIVGLKIDFWDGQGASGHSWQGEDRSCIEWLDTVYQTAAKYKMMVNIHGGNKPTGERRLYPNVINREGIKGNEMRGSISSLTTVNQMYTRNIVGPSDFTPVVKTLGTLTYAHQMALAVLYDCGMTSLADIPDRYIDGGIMQDFYSYLPTSRDESLFLDGAWDKNYVSACRKGDDWWIAGINCYEKTSTSFDLSFLSDGDYTATIYTDDEATEKPVSETRTLTASDSMSFDMLSNGGFIVRLVKNS